MKRMRRWRWGAALMALLMAAGCVETALMTVGAAAALGTYKWIEGTMERDYPKSMEPVWHACLAACRVMGLRVSGEGFGPIESRIDAMQPDGTQVKIQLIARPNMITTVKVRFGVWGNKDYSAYFHRRVSDALGMPPG
ncbi:MAG: DUF3568 family protein [Deltaproteobacteria bacterium]|nr:DUF3568 family protein [Deltaproteobacteria bacterium]